MFKKALITLLSSTVLATSIPVGVVGTPTVAYASDIKTVYVSEDDCITIHEAGSGEMVDNWMYKNDEGKYYFGAYEYSDDEFMVYPVTTVPVIIETDNSKYKIDASYKVTSWDVDRDEEEAKYKKWIKEMVVCKHPSAGNVTLSASEKKGTLTVTKADIKTAIKLDKMLKQKKALTIKVKASSKSKAVSQFKALRKLTGHANTYGVQPWVESKQGIPCTDKVNAYNFKQSGSFYTVKISKSISKNYNYICKAYENAFKWGRKNTKYDFAKGTHLCDCSDLAKVKMFATLILHNYTYDYDTWAKDEHTPSDFFHYTIKPEDEFKALAGRNMYMTYTCGGMARLAQKVSWASGIASKYVRWKTDNPNDETHAVAGFNIKNSSGKVVDAIINNGAYRNMTDDKFQDGYVKVKGINNDADAVHTMIDGYCSELYTEAEANGIGFK